MSTTTTKTWTIEHDWTCGHCQYKNRGRDDRCFNCGKPIDSTHTEHVPTDMSYENRVKDTDRFEDKRPDWVCGFCNHRNPAARSDCKECGGKKGEKKAEVKAGQDTTAGGMSLDSKGKVVDPPKTASWVPPQKYPTDKNGEPSHFEEFHSSSEKPEVIKNPNYQGPDPVSSASYDPLEPVKDAPKGKKTVVQFGQGAFRSAQVEIEEPPPPPGFFARLGDWFSENLKMIGLVGGIGSVVLGFVYLMVWLFAWHDTTAVITSTRWEYNVSLRQRQINHGRDWRDQEHAHAFNESCHTAIRSYHNCNPHDCNPHQVSYSCNCRSVRSCRPVTSCRTSCSSNGNRSSSCSESCTTSESCSSSTECSTCYRTEYDTCYDRCPDYDQMCDYDYPAWPQVNRAVLTGSDHTPVRPNLSAPGNVSCPGDEETLNIRNRSVTQCTMDTVSFRVDFDAGSAGTFSRNPSTLSEYNRYRQGATWNVQYNHAGMFREVGPREP